ncbi:MAG: hypothetical protein IKF71_01480 [Bacilli bacterium]|nr:hypothetical protein [Bacilli bacterium]
MDSLKQLFRDGEVEQIISQNPEIKIRNKEDIRKILKLLSDQKCNHRVMRYILMINPFVLTRNPEELEELIYKLKEYHVIHLDKVFEGDPYLMSKNSFDIDCFFFTKQKEGYSDQEIVEILENEPYQIEMTDSN